MEATASVSNVVAPNMAKSVTTSNGALPAGRFRSRVANPSGITGTRYCVIAPTPNSDSWMFRCGSFTSPAIMPMFIHPWYAQMTPTIAAPNAPHFTAPQADGHAGDMCSTRGGYVGSDTAASTANGSAMMNSSDP